MNGFQRSWCLILSKEVSLLDRAKIDSVKDLKKSTAISDAFVLLRMS